MGRLCGTLERGGTLFYLFNCCFCFKYINWFFENYSTTKWQRGGVVNAIDSNNVKHQFPSRHQFPSGAHVRIMPLSIFLAPALLYCGDLIFFGTILCTIRMSYIHRSRGILHYLCPGSFFFIGSTLLLDSGNLQLDKLWIVVN